MKFMKKPILTRKSMNDVDPKKCNTYHFLIMS